MNLDDKMVSGQDFTSGIGIGLTNAKVLTESLGGKIDLDSTYGIGTKVQFTIDLYDDQPNASLRLDITTKSKNPLLELSNSLNRRKAKVLNQNEDSNIYDSSVQNHLLDDSAFSPFAKNNKNASNSPIEQFHFLQDNRCECD